jgi:hypothetical protein
MKRAMTPSYDPAAEREALRRRVKQMVDWFNRGLWDKCFSLIDPKLREQSKVDSSIYAQGLQSFKEAYGMIRPWYVRISLHLDASSNKRDGRPFAYVYVVWQDDAHQFHMFRERWVRDSDHWFTRVVGLIPNRQDTARAQE